MRGCNKPQFKLLSTLLAMVLTACGGGGGSSGSDSSGSGSGSNQTSEQKQQQAYEGEAGFSTVDATNFKLFTNLVFSLPTDESGFQTSAKPSGNPLQAGEEKHSELSLEVSGPVQAGNKVSSVMMSTSQANQVGSSLQKITIDESEPCDSGVIRLDGTVEDDGTGTVDVSFDSCVLDGVMAEGEGSLTITNFDAGSSQILSGSFFYDSVRFTGPGFENVVVGDFEFDNTAFSSSFVLSLVINDVLEDVTYWFRDFSFSATRQFSQMNVALQGRVYHPDHGYIEVESLGNVTFDEQLSVASEGRIRLAGFSSSMGEVEINDTYITLTLDADGDGVYESGVQSDWDGLTEVSGDNRAPQAVMTVVGSSGIVPGEPVELSGLTSTDPDADFLTFTWQVIDEPFPGAGELTVSDLPEVTFTASTRGAYTLGLVVNDGELSSVTEQITLLATDTVALSHDVIDAEYSKALDAIVMVSSYPDNALYLFDVADNSEVSLPLAKLPTSVSVSPNGLSAAVGHDALITMVDLNTLEDAAVDSDTLLDVSTNVFDIVMDGNGFVHAFPETDQWVNIHSVEVATNTEFLSASRSIYQRTKAKLHPTGIAVYGADNGLSPSDIEKYDISAGQAVYLYDSPYHGDYAMCGDLWIREDGESIITACGNVFRSSTSQELDMRYQGSLQLATAPTFSYRISSASHSSSQGEISIIQTSWVDCRDSNWDDCAPIITNYEDDFFNEEYSFEMTPIMLNGTDYRQLPEHIFHSSSGEEHFIISRLVDIPSLSDEYHISKY